MASVRDPIERGLVGPAGEHYVLFKLYREGMLASLSPPGLATVDIIVLSFTEDIVATLQVKTRTRGRDGGWHMRDKHESVFSNRHFYALVDLEPDPPITYIVPSAKVAQVLREAHEAWATTPGRNGKPRNRANTMRRIQPSYPDSGPGFEDGWLDEYRERWDQLRLAVDQV